MAQATDYVLANQSGANFRSELNSVLAAVVSQNSGSTAPSTTYSYQWWIDTGVSPALLKLRNGVLVSSFQNDISLTARRGAVTVQRLAADGDITLNAQSDVRFADSDSSNYIALQAPSTVASNVTFTLPATDGTSNQALKTDGAGALGWATYAGLDTAQTWTKGQRGEVTALTDGTTITPDFSDSNNFSVTLGGNRTLANPTNLVAGQSGAIFISQDGTGSRTLAFGSYWDFTGGTAPTLTTTASAVDVLAYYCESTTRISARLIADLK